VEYIGFNQRLRDFPTKQLEENSKRNMLEATRTAKTFASDMNFFKVYASVVFLHNQLIQASLN
jgi:hypothetical protein